MNEKILLVDDDVNLLSSAERILRRKFQLETANGAEAGLAKIAERGPYAVVISDRQMPGMDGIQFLSLVKQRAPDTVRMMLTGNADLEAAIKVVNEGGIFTFLTKPCPPDVLSNALDNALAQYRLIMAEKELLSKTLSGSIKLLTDILSIMEPQSFGRAQTMRDVITAVASKLKIENAWEIHLALMLAPIGFVTIPPETLVKARNSEVLSKVEEQMVIHVPETAARLLANIPRLEGVSRIVRYQHKHFDGTGFPPDLVSGEKIPLGSRLLRILTDIAELQSAAMTKGRAIDELQQRVGWYDPVLLAAVRTHYYGNTAAPVESAHLSLSVAIADLGQIVLRSNMLTKEGTLILSAGHQINDMTLEKIQNFDRISGIKEPIFVEAPPLATHPVVS